jgi:hypothetical protein
MKRGMDAQDTMVGLVLLAVVVLIVLPFIFRLGGTVDRAAEIDTCKTTVAIAAKDPSNFIDINCPTDEIVIKEDGAYVRTLRSKTYSPYLSVALATEALKAQGNANPTQEQLLRTFVQQVIANEAILCWDKMGKGQVDPFNSRLFQGDTTRCVSCAVIRLDEPVKQKVGDIKVKALLDYFKTAKTKDGKTIYDYLAPSTVKPFIVDLNPTLDKYYGNMLDASLQNGVTVNYLQTDTSWWGHTVDVVTSGYMANVGIVPQGWNSKCDALY